MMYKLIIANDIVVSITVLPVGISFLSKGQPGLIFGNKYGCIMWDYLWRIAVSLSVFLVLCLCVTRTISLLRPFKRQKTKYLLFAVVTYLLIVLALIIVIKSVDGAHTIFDEFRSRCDLFVDSDQRATNIFYVVCMILFYTAPAIVVIISCTISVVVLRRRNRNVQQRELQQSRNRATVTILLFALLYGVCNMPLVVDFMFFTFGLAKNDMQIYANFYQFDKHLYYDNASATLLLAANSAANPILYFWRMPALGEYIMSGIRRMLGLNREVRMPALREYIMSGMRRMLGLNREVRMPALREYIMSGIRRMLRLNREVRRPAVNIVQLAETRRFNTVLENINIAPTLPSGENLETRL